MATPTLTLPSNAKDRAIGTIIGSALGDTIGLYTEFLPKSEAQKHYPKAKFSLVEPVTKWVDDHHRSRFDERAWTDDTDQALLLLLSYLHTPGTLSAPDLAARLRLWIRGGIRTLHRAPLGIGNLVGSVLTSPGYLDAPALTARRIWISRGRALAPNGSLMRTHPVGVMGVAWAEEAAWRVAAEAGLVTHADPRCVVACCASVGLVRGMLRGELRGEADVDGCLERAYAWVRATPEYGNPGAGGETALGPLVEEEEIEGLLDRAEWERHVYAKGYAELELDDARKMGYVYKCLGAAVLALRFAMRESEKGAGGVPGAAFEKIMVDLIMEGGDADTNGAAAGALVGCWYGYSRLPEHWSKGLAHVDWLLEKTDALRRVAGILEEGESSAYEPTSDTALDYGMGELTDKDVEDMEKRIMERVLMSADRRRKESERKDEAKKGWFKSLLGSSS